MITEGLQNIMILRNSDSANGNWEFNELFSGYSPDLANKLRLVNQQKERKHCYDAVLRAIFT